MTTYAVGDIHGRLDYLRDLIERLDLKPEDKLVFLGDYVDRGQHSKGVLDYLIELSKTYECVFVLGNHEQQMLRSRTSKREYWTWVSYGYGGDATVESYGIRSDIYDPNWMTKIPAEHWEFIENMVDFHETDEALFVHASYIHDQDASTYDENTLRWCIPQMLGPQPLYKGSKITFVGHTPTGSGEPEVFADSCVMVDTGCGKGYGPLSAVDVQSYIYGRLDRFWQSQVEVF